MKFWDSSAIVALLLDDPRSSYCFSLLDKDSKIAVWWGTRLEAASALARREREGRLKPQELADAYERLENYSQGWSEISPAEAIRETALRFVRVHPLRAADAFQLASAWVASEARPPVLDFVSLDQRLNVAAAKEGFPLSIPTA